MIHPNGYLEDSKETQFFFISLPDCSKHTLHQLEEKIFFEVQELSVMVG